MNYKLEKKLDKIHISFKKIDKIISEVFLYYASICGFILGWVCMAGLLLFIGDELPTVFILILRIFYFLISFLFSLKITIFIVSFLKRHF